MYNFNLHSCYKKAAEGFLLLLTCSCANTPDSETHATGYLSLNIHNAGTKSEMEIIDFTLRINDQTGVKVVESVISDLPELIELPVDQYEIAVFSAPFSEPKFETPCYSGKTNVAIVAGSTQEASLTCSLSNAGVRILWSDEFVAAYHTYQVELSGSSGYLTYSSSETRTGYFEPGVVSLVVTADGIPLNRVSITLAAKDMVNITLRPTIVSTGSLSVQVDIDETVNEKDIDIRPNENSRENPYVVADAIGYQGQNDVWVIGYIVGAKPSSGWVFTNSAMWLATNIVLADDASETDDLKCLPVELPTGAIRTALSLLSNPTLLYRQIVVKGNLATYYSRPGLRSTSAYSFE
jgi:hypothetical protein